MPRKKLMAVTCIALSLTACGGGSDGLPPVSLPSAAELCASQGITPKIANGTTCQSPEKSSVVVLGVWDSNDAGGTCSGVLVKPDVVLTAAHCVEDAQQIATLQWRADGSYAFVDASRWVAHPDYRETKNGLFNDVAVVFLRSPLSNPTMPVLTSERAAVGQAYYIAGWGDPALDLTIGMVQLGSVNDSHLGYTYRESLSNSCPGDSGGPMYRIVHGQPAVVGLTSSGSSKDCSVGDRSLFTNLQGAVLGFVRDQVPGLPEI